MLKLLYRRQAPTQARTGKNTTKNKETLNFDKKFWRIACMFLLGSLILLGWLEIHNSATLAIKKVNIAGNYQHIDPKDLEKVLTPYVETGFFSVNLADLKNRLLQIPWIADASVAKVWPDTINIKINEQKPTAVWNDDNLVNQKGEIFSPAKATFPAGLPNFYGPVGQQALVQANFLQMQTLFLPLHLRIVAIELTPRQAWRLKLDNGAYIILGRTDILEHLHRLVLSYPKIIGTRDSLVNYIDLRYNNGIAINWKEQMSSGSSSTGEQ